MTKACINSCLSLSDHIEIILVPNIAIHDIDDIRVKIIESGDVSIAAKRNLGSLASSRSILAFIDNDVVPTNIWVKSALDTFNRSSYFAVGGPNVSPKSQSPQEAVVGEVMKSFLISGFGSFRKRISRSRETSFLPSCNFFILRKTFLKLDGMDERLYTGEDIELCSRLEKLNLTIYFANRVIVFHKNRNFINFIKQRFVYGAGIKNMVARNNLWKRTIVLLVPFIFVVVILTFPFVKGHEQLFLIWKVAISSYLILILFETIRVCKHFACFPLIFLLLMIGTVMPGIGTLFGPFISLRLKKKLYVNN